MSKLVENILEKGTPSWEEYNELVRKGLLEAFFEGYILKKDGKQGPPDNGTVESAKHMALTFRRETYEVNHGKIKAAILNHLAKTNGMPAVAQIAKATELSRQTVYTHLQTFDLSEYFPDEIQKYQVAFMGIMDVLIGRCMSGDTKAMRLYFDIMAFANRRNPEAGFLLGKPISKPKSDLTREEIMARIEGLHAKMGMKLVKVE